MGRSTTNRFLFPSPQGGGRRCENEFMLGDVLGKRVADEMKLFMEIAERVGI